MIRLASRIGDISLIRRNTKPHRTVVGALTANPAALAAYRQLAVSLLIDWIPLTEENWGGGVRTDVLTIASALCDGATQLPKAASFISWVEETPSTSDVNTTTPNDAGPNVYRVLDGERHVDIRLGTIHSVKGQTHLATLVLNTFRHDHWLNRMLPWLLGDKANENGAGSRDVKWLLQTYVAMTRPSHMVCLAVPRSLLGDAEAFTHHIGVLQARGWKVAELIEGEIVPHA